MNNRHEKEIVKEADTFKRRQSHAPASHEKGSCHKNLETLTQVGQPNNARKGETPASPEATVWPLYVAPARLPDDLKQWFHSNAAEIGFPPAEDAA